MVVKLEISGLFGAAPLPDRAACFAELPGAALARQRHLDDEPSWRTLHARKDLLDACTARADAVRAAHAPEFFVVLGIGGSALGNAAMTAALAPVMQEWRPTPGTPRVFVLDNVDPDWLGEFFEAVPGDRVHFNVISKSGGTIETSSQFLLAWQHVRAAVGSDAEARTRFTITTDPSGGHFRSLCDQQGFATLPVPPGVGGRYSVLSPVGLFTAAMGGFDPASLLEGAAKTDARLRAAPPDQDPALLYALAHVMHMRLGRNNHVHFVYSHRARLLAAWYQQLWAESLGKKRDRDGKLVHVGPTPLGAVGPTDQHSQVQLYAEGPDDKVYTFLSLDRFGRELAVPPPFAESAAFSTLRGRRFEELMKAEREGTEIALAQAGRPWCRIELCRLDAFHLGAYFLFLEVATALAGEMLHIDPFDQPGVEAGKRNALALMGAAGFESLGAELLAARAAGESWRLSC